MRSGSTGNTAVSIATVTPAGESSALPGAGWRLRPSARNVWPPAATVRSGRCGR